MSWKSWISCRVTSHSMSCHILYLMIVMSYQYDKSASVRSYSDCHVMSCHQSQSYKCPKCYVMSSVMSVMSCYVSCHVTSVTWHGHEITSSIASPWDRRPVMCHECHVLSRVMSCHQCHVAWSWAHQQHRIPVRQTSEEQILRHLAHFEFGGRFPSLQRMNTKSENVIKVCSSLTCSYGRW